MKVFNPMNKNRSVLSHIHLNTLNLCVYSLFKISLFGIVTAGVLLSVLGLGQAQYLNKGAKTGGLPPFFASMEKHEVMVSVFLNKKDGTRVQAPKGLPVGFRILAQGQKVRDYHEKTDEQGRAFFLGIPSNPKVQMSISYEVWADYEGVRTPYELEGFPTTVNKDALYEDFNPKVRLPENRVVIELLEPESGLTGLTLNHDKIMIHIDEESMFVQHEMTLKNQSNQLLDLSHQPNGGLKLSAPIGAKTAEIHQKRHEEVEVRGIDLYYIGALLPHSEKTIQWVYTLPYDADTFEWSQTMPVPSTTSLILTPQYKKTTHQKTFKLYLKSRGMGEVVSVSTDRNMPFHSLRNQTTLAANEPLKFAITNIPAPSLWKRYALLALTLLACVFVMIIGLKEGEEQILSKTQILIERERLIKALARMELALKKKRITQKRYQREKEAITARLVTIYRALEKFDAQMEASASTDAVKG
jgi:hypothetical protein